jgi:hypothetical protein
MLRMKEKYIQTFGIVLVFFGFSLVAWLYLAAPQSLAEVPSKARETIENATSKGQILTGTYEIDQTKFNEALAAFRTDNFIVARDNFSKADPENRDAKTQFYIAYTFYRQGWGRTYNDDALFKQGLEQINRVIALDKNFRSDDENLKLKTPVELKNEFEEGLRTTPEDFNPFKVFRERK